MADQWVCVLCCQIRWGNPSAKAGGEDLQGPVGLAAQVPKPTQVGPSHRLPRRKPVPAGKPRWLALALARERVDPADRVWLVGQVDPVVRVRREVPAAPAVQNRRYRRWTTMAAPSSRLRLQRMQLRMPRQVPFRVQLQVARPLPVRIEVRLVRVQQVQLVVRAVRRPAQGVAAIRRL